MPPSISKSKVTPSFCFAFKIPDDVTATIKYNSPTVVDFSKYCPEIKITQYLMAKKIYR